MEGQVETNFDLLRAWDFTNLYEKSYFILVHFALLLLGIYSIKSRILDRKARVRPSSSYPGDHANAKPPGSQESRFKSDRDVIWATEISSWLLENSYADDAINTWKSKMNVRLLQNMSKGKIQIDDLNKDDVIFSVDKIRSYKPEIKEQMNIIVYVHIDKLEFRITHASEDGKSSSSSLLLRSLSPLLHIQLVGFNGKIRTCLKLSWLNLEDFEIYLDNEDINAELVKDTFRRSLQDTVTLEPTRGILKKEIKTETKVKEISSQVYEECFEEDSKRHILVTDLDSAIAKISSNSLLAAEDDMAKEGDETPLKLSITLPIQRTSLLPEIKVLPATPITTDLDESGMFFAENLPSDAEERSVTTNGESDFNVKSLAEDHSEQKLERRSQDGLRDGEMATQINANAELCELSVALSADENSMEENEESLFEEKNPTEKTEDVIESGDKVIEKESEEKPGKGSLNDFRDTSSESSKESWSLRNEQIRARPKSVSEMELDNNGDVDHGFNVMMLALKDGSALNIERVNTFHLGSKSMVSIATTPKRSDSTPLRATASQLSLVSPIGYSPSKPSALIIEADEQGRKRHYHVPPAIARKGTYEQHGIKLHIYNGHIFIAQHFSKPLPLCAVCNLPLVRRIGKQGYQCRDCKAITHKRCHNLIGACEESSLPSLTIEYPWSTEV